MSIISNLDDLICGAIVATYNLARRKAPSILCFERLILKVTALSCVYLGTRKIGSDAYVDDLHVYNLTPQYHWCCIFTVLRAKRIHHGDFFMCNT